MNELEITEQNAILRELVRDADSIIEALLDLPPGDYHGLAERAHALVLTDIDQWMPRARQMIGP